MNIHERTNQVGIIGRRQFLNVKFWFFLIISSASKKHPHLEPRLADKVKAAWYHPGVHLQDHCLVLLSDAGRQGVEPGLHQWLPAQHGRLHVDHATPGDCGRRGHLKVHGLKDEVGGGGKLDDLTTHEAELKERAREIGRIIPDMKPI